MKSRYRITYAKNELMRYTANLDVHKAWERTFRRAKLPLAYSQGFHPQPRIQQACPLPLGFLSEHEILDFFSDAELDPAQIRQQLQDKTPPGFDIKDIERVEPSQPALQVQTQAVRYRIEFLEAVDSEKISADCRALMEKESITRIRRGKAYDLRPLILDLAVCSTDSQPYIRSTLSAREAATGRPEEVLDELSIPFQTVRITRERTLLNETA